MTLARLEIEMSVEELELWMAEDQLRHDECPNCGVEPRDMMDWDYVKLHCPTCKTDYNVTRRRTPWPSYQVPVLLEASQEATL